jgi:hypothetical protein
MAGDSERPVKAREWNSQFFTTQPRAINSPMILSGFHRQIARSPVGFYAPFQNVLSGLAQADAIPATCPHFNGLP